MLRGSKSGEFKKVLASSLINTWKDRDNHQPRISQKVFGPDEEIVVDTGD